MAAEHSAKPYRYEALRDATSSFRIVEILPSVSHEGPISCLLHEVDWSNLRDYEGVSYAWGNPKTETPIFIDGKVIQVTQNLHTALTHLRYGDRSRFLWADAICTNQSDIPERGAQVKQMRRIYQSAKTVVIWLGPDNETRQGTLALESIHQITNMLFKTLDICLEDVMSEEQVYHEILFKHRARIPLPNECDFVTNEMWDALLWLYKHPYFTRIWAIQEINAQKSRVVYCGENTIQWDLVELIAGYIILEPAFSSGHGFTDSYCWWASTVSSEPHQAKNWLHMLSPVSNFKATDPRDVSYGPREMMECEEGGELLDLDYSKSTVQVYRDSVEAAFLNYKTTNALLYVHGVENPSWVPRWDQPMLFRNPFRFGKAVPWRPAGESVPEWSIDKDPNVLSLAGLVLDSVETAEPYYEMYFRRVSDLEEKKQELNGVWQRIFGTMANSLSSVPLDDKSLTAAANSFSFGLDEMCKPADERVLFYNFVAYLKTVVDSEMYDKYISPEAARKCKDGQGDVFGKPVWDFEYPTSTFFVT